MRPRVLYLTHRVPYPPDKGDRIRNWHVLRGLAGRFRVSLGCLADEPVPDAARAKLGEVCERVAIVPVSRSHRLLGAGRSFLGGRSLSEGAFSSCELALVIDAWQGESPFSAIVASATSLVPYLRRPAFRSVPAFVDVVDVDSRKWLDFADTVSFPKSWLYRREAARVRRLEQDLPRWAKASVLVSPAEARLFDSIAGPGSALVATNGVDLDYFRPTPPSPEPIAAFVGALDYLPNVDAAAWFATSVWPAIRARRPDAEFHLIGRNPVPRVRRLASVPGIVVVGSVPDVRLPLARASVAVVPMRLSRGLQNKVLEALAMGLATIAAPPALVALRTVPDRHLLRAETPDEWITAILDLFDHPAKRLELGRAGRAFVEEHHDWTNCLEPFLDRIAQSVPKPQERLRPEEVPA
jgi:sugar transferase (PEP-CTERM/EpsH1 system associated)